MGAINTTNFYAYAKSSKEENVSKDADAKRMNETEKKED